MVRFLGYDPGGKGNHGVATLEVSAQGIVTAASVDCVETGEDALRYFNRKFAQGEIGGFGVDTLTEWSLGHAGLRPADLDLRKMYPDETKSVISPNSLRGSMCLNGMGVVYALRAQHPELVVSETHPKVLYFALAPTRYDWANSAAVMCQWLFSQFGLVTRQLGTDHEFDALLSAWACMQGVYGRWGKDLHKSSGPNTAVVRPVGPTNYFWP